MIASFQAKPGQEQRLQDELNAMIAPSLAEAGCVGYRPLLDPNRLGAMVIVEEWRGPAALQTHFGTPHFQHVAQVLDEILVEPFMMTMLTPLEDPPPPSDRRQI
jgi:quinol monooxygenase YgiN